MQHPCACKQICVSVSRLWQGQLNQSFPLWSSTGIYPVAGRQDGETWKQLVSTAYGMKLPEPSDNPAPATAYYDRIKELWNKGQRRAASYLLQHLDFQFSRYSMPQMLESSASVTSTTHEHRRPAGKERVRLDFHLCYAERRSSRWSELSSQPYFKTETTVMLLELVYFFWFEEKQLSRGAKMLAKVPHMHFLSLLSCTTSCTITSLLPKYVTATNPCKPLHTQCLIGLINMVKRD